MLLAGACKREPTKAEQDAADARAIAAVEAVQDTHPPIQPVTPEAISAGDMERFGLLGIGCAFVPGSRRDGDPIIVVGPTRATVKLEGRMRTFASDPGAKSLPMGAWTHYVGKDLTLEIEQIAPANALPKAGPARFTVKDRFDRVVHAEDGSLICGS
ncbi:hypothetical protein ACOYW6_03345 [Parablastomonas sp. CN1-191]|uniref:hypothetical protein n=1 Tax=Parablastomonas sp. CN1-191 TaxID=3400908 RepID=UPI003BF82B7C